MLQMELPGYPACSAYSSLACLLVAVDKSRGSKSVEVQRVWEVYDERLQFMSRRDALLLDESLGADDVSMAWVVWSRAAESALLDTYWFSGGPLPSRGLVLGRGSAMFRVVRLGGHPVRKARGYAADVHDAACVFLYRDASLAPLLDMRRRFKAVMDVLDAMIRSGISLSRSVELTAQLDKILALGPLHLVTLAVLDLSFDRGMGVGAFFHAASGVHRRLSDFIHAMVVCRRDEAVRGGAIGFVKIPWFIPIGGFAQIWLPLLFFFTVCLISRLVVLGFLLILLGLTRNSERLGFPIFAALGKGRPALRNSILRWRSGCLFYLRFLCLG